ncbi:MAG: IS30 family transposase [Patescibacteria group bacterium]
MHDEFTHRKTRGTYDPQKAHHKAYVKRKYSKYQGMKIVGNPKLQEFVDEKLYDDQSPENISGRIKKHEKHLPPVSKDSIYRYISSVYGRWVEYYRSKRKKRRWNRRRTINEKLKERKFIDQRPKIAENRRRIGDAEADFIVSGKSGKGILLVVADRKSRVPFIEKIIDVTVANVHQAFVRIKKRFSELKTITTDNDILFQRFKELEILIKVKIYFCHPYHSWEKGTVENINGYIRKDIPKGSDISKYSKQFIRSIEEKLQRRIMEVLDHKTPIEVLKNSRKQKKRRSAKRKIQH